MVMEVNVFPIETETGSSQTGFTLRVRLSGRARWAWMDYNVIFRVSPDSPSQITKSFTVDGKQEMEHDLFCNKSPDLKKGYEFQWKVEVWKKSSVEQEQRTMITPMNRMEFENLSDLTIKCGDKSIKVHKVQLAKSSEVFKSKY